MSGGASTPTTRPRRPQTRAEVSQSILQQRTSWRTYYPEITRDKLQSMSYTDLVTPLKQNSRALPQAHKKFFKSAKDLEGKLSRVARRGYSYAEVKSRIADKQPFTLLESSIRMITSRTGGTPSLPRPDVAKLYSAASTSEFEAKLQNRDLVHEKFYSDATFLQRARAVFQTVQKFRRDNAANMQSQVVVKYIDELYKAKDTDELKQFIHDSATINRSLITPHMQAEILKSYAEYNAYRNYLEKKLVVSDKIHGQQTDLLSQPFSYARSGERSICVQINKLRESFGSATGGQKVAFGLLALIGTSMFLNSQHEAAVKLRGIIGKGLVVGGIAVLANTGSKIIFKRSLADQIRTYTTDKSGRRDFFKNSFQTNKEGALALSETTVLLGNLDAEDIFAEYMVKYEYYEQNPTPEKLKKLSLGNVADTRMPPKRVWLAMRLIDRKLRKQGSSIGDMHKHLVEARKKAKREGRRIDRMTMSQMLASILQHDPATYSVDRQGNVTWATTQTIDTNWRGSNRRNTQTWWVFTGAPANWRDRFNTRRRIFPRNRVQGRHLGNISRHHMDIDQPLSAFMTDPRFGRFAPQFKKLYNYEIKRTPSAKFHSWDSSREKAGYAASKVKIDSASFRDFNTAKVNATQNAYKQGLDKLRKKYLKKYKGRPDIEAILRGRFHEFVQPVQGVFQAHKKSPPKRFGDKFKKPTHYVMFLRVSLPESLEWKMRAKHEWTDGHVRNMMKNKPMQRGDSLTINDYKNLASEAVHPATKKRYGVEGSPYYGAYEAFLGNFRLNKRPVALITKTLANISRAFAGQGITKRGLISFLASHTFSPAEIKKFRGMTAAEKYPNQGHDRLKLVRQKVQDAFVHADGTIAALKRRMASSSVINAVKITRQIAKIKKYKAQLYGGLDNLFIAMSNGDGDALAQITKILGPTAAPLITIILSTVNPIGAPTPSQIAMYNTQVLPKFEQALMGGVTKAPLQTKLIKATKDYQQT